VVKSFDEIYTPLGCYSALSGSSVPTFRDNLSVPSSTVSCDREVIPKRRYRTTTQRCVISQNSADLIYIAAEAQNHANVSTWMSTKSCGCYHVDL
jgi:hypothetical protein